MSEGKDTHSPELVAKVAAHERDIANLTTAVQSLSATMQETAEAQWRSIREQGEILRSAIQQQGQEVRSDINALGDKFSESRAVNWPLIVSTAVAGLAITSLAVTVMTIIGNMALTPVQQRLDEHIADAPPQRIEAVEERIKSLEAQMNLMQQKNFILLNATRREANLEPLDMPNYWPRTTKGSD